MRPRQYISQSQINLLESNEQKYIDQYIYGEKQRLSRNIVEGSKLAHSLEDDELTGNPLLDLMAVKLPKLDLADKVVEDENGQKVWYDVEQKYIKVPVLMDGKEPIPLLAKPDTASVDYSAIKEYKSSVRKWTQKDVDESSQITFYCTAIWLKTKKIPEDIELDVVEMKYDEQGRVVPTGNIIPFKTKRTMVDVIKMMIRIKKAWKRIGEISERELF
jgi:hypothetical protein